MKLLTLIKSTCNKKKIASRFLIFLLPTLLLNISISSFCYAGTTRYVDPASPSPGGGYTSWNTAAHDIQTGVGAMSSGDELIIRDGTYIGAANMITAGSIPSGSVGNYTMVRAENRMGVIIDAQVAAVRRPISIGSSDEYIIIKDIEGQNAGDFEWNQGSAVVMIEGNHIKMIRVGAMESAWQTIDPGENEMSNPFDVEGASYVLLEECYAYGWGKYVFTIYASDHIILRRCISRQDGWARGFGSSFQNYSSKFVEYQNCIAIDYNEARHWHPSINDGLWGGFCINGTSSNVIYRGSIAMNIKGPNGVTLHDNSGTIKTTDHNMGFYSTVSGVGEYYNCAVINSITGIVTRGNNIIDHCSFMTLDSDPSTLWDGRAVMGESGEAATVTNSIFYNSATSSAAFNININSDYNAYYSNLANYGGGSTAGVNDYSSENSNELNLLTSGLLFPIRIESGSKLKTAGSEGSQIGAEIMKRYGIDGTLYGEAGYNILTNVELWPFPNEDIIRARMRTYTHWDKFDNIDPNNQSNPDTWVKGKRGFCADGMTLTKYIWEALGSQVPPDLYSATTLLIDNIIISD